MTFNPSSFPKTLKAALAKQAAELELESAFLRFEAAYIRGEPTQVRAASDEVLRAAQAKMDAIASLHAASRREQGLG